MSTRKPKIKSDSTRRKANAKLGYGETSKNINTLRKIEAVNQEEKGLVDDELFFDMSEIPEDDEKADINIDMQEVDRLIDDIRNANETESDMIKEHTIKIINSKGTEIIRINEGYYVMEDNWITDYDKILIDKNGNNYQVLDYKVIEEDIWKYERWFTEKRTYLKLDKPVKIGDMLYVDYMKKKLIE